MTSQQTGDRGGGVGGGGGGGGVECVTLNRPTIIQKSNHPHQYQRRWTLFSSHISIACVWVCACIVWMQGRGRDRVSYVMHY